MKAVLQFKNYNVIETAYKSDPNFNKEEAKISPDIYYDLNLIGGSNETADLDLVISLGDVSLQNNSFFVKAHVRGHFTVEGDVLKHPEKVIRFYKENGIAILFPYVRSLISDLTSKGNDIPIIFPTINIVELIKNKEKNEKEQRKAISIEKP